MSATVAASSPAHSTPAAWRVDLAFARRHVRAGELTLVLARDGRVLAEGRRPGIADLAGLAGQPTGRFQGAVLADQVVGRAAALLARHLGLAAVYAGLTSRSAVDELAAAGIALEFSHLALAILDRTRRHLCPFEALTQNIQDPAQALAAIEAFLGQGRS